MNFMSKSAAVIAVGIFPTISLADFTGGYAGVAISSVGGDIELPEEFGFDGIGLGINNDVALSGFGGYQIQSGNLVYGAEIVLSQATDGGIAGVVIEDLDTVATDIKGRLGYVFNDKVMAYGTAGFSRLSIDLDPLGVDDQLDADGFIVGAGVDYLVSENIVLGAEFTNRQVDGSIDVFGDDVDLGLDVNSFAVRAAFKF